MRSDVKAGASRVQALLLGNRRRNSDATFVLMRFDISRSRHPAFPDGTESYRAHFFSRQGDTEIETWFFEDDLVVEITRLHAQAHSAMDHELALFCLRVMTFWSA